MKTSVVALFFFLPFISFSQDCSIQKEKDKYTREIKLTTGFFNLRESSLRIDAVGKEVDFFFRHPNQCYNSASTVEIYFEGVKTKVNQKVSGSMNCHGVFHMIFKSVPTKPILLKKLATTKVVQFIFIGADKKQTILTLTPEEQTMLNEKLNCLLTEFDKIPK